MPTLGLGLGLSVSRPVLPAAVEVDPPANTVAPALNNTAPRVGQTVSCGTGAWTNHPASYAYQWKRDGVNIGGETASSHVVVSADIGKVLTCAVTATNDGGDSTPELSNATNAILSNVVTLSAFTIEGQDVVDGGSLDLDNSYIGAVIGDLTVVATPTNGGATVGVKTITPSPLVEGNSNVLAFDVTAADGVASNHYNVTLNVAAADPPSNDTSLSAFTINGQNAVNGGTVNLANSHIGDEIGDLVIVATPTDAGANVGVKSLTPTSLALGDNVLEFDVTAADDTVEHYSVTVHVFNNATTFTVDGVPHVDGDTINLTSGVTSAVIAAADDGSIEDLVGDTGLSEGDNECTFTVLAEDGVTSLDVTLNLHVLTAGAFETAEIVAVADVAGSLHGKSLVMNDGDGTVGVYFDDGSLPEITEMDFTGMTGANFVTNSTGKSFTIYGKLAGVETAFRVWINTGTEVAPSASNLIEVGVNPEISEFFLAESVGFVLDSHASGAWVGTNIDAVSVITDVNSGPRTNAADVDCGVPISVTQEGRNAATAPTGVDRVISVFFTHNDDAATIAAALAAALEADAQFTATSVDDTVTVSDVEKESVTDAVDVDTGFAITTTVQGVAPV